MSTSLCCQHVILLVCLTWTAILSAPGPDGYRTAMKLFEDKLGPANYNPDVRPVVSSSDVVTVETSFNLLALVAVNDVEQTFVANGFIVFCWNDAMLHWDPDDYNGTDLLVPQPKQVWRPRVILLNTMDERDPFEDTHSPLVVFNTGQVCWGPGALFTVSCILNMEKYPFDTQSCAIQFCAMTYFSDKVKYQTSPSVEEEIVRFAQASGEWSLVSSSMQTTEVFLSKYTPSSCITVKFVMERRWQFYLSNIIIPVLLISFLNLLVFLIPIETGTKIGYGMTVLLAMAVFMTMVSTLMPRSSDARPALTTYLFVLLVGSVLSVVVTIANVCLHHRSQVKEENVNSNLESEHSARYQANGHDTCDCTAVNRTSLQPTHQNFASNGEVRQQKTITTTKGNNPNKIHCSLDMICFVGFLALWIGANVWYFTTVTA